MLECRDLAAMRGENVLFAHLNLKLLPGEIIRLSGPNGCGKTTLLKLLAGLRLADAGEILWQSKPIARQRNEWHEALLYVGHKPGISPELTALENLSLLCGLRRRIDEERILEVLQSLRLGARSSLPVSALSAGQKQRVALATLVLSPAQVWLLDEPLTALDTDGQTWLEQQLYRHAEVGGCAIITTHQTFGQGNPAIRAESMDQLANLAVDAL